MEEAFQTRKTVGARARAGKKLKTRTVSRMRRRGKSFTHSCRSIEKREPLDQSYCTPVSVVRNDIVRHMNKLATRQDVAATKVAEVVTEGPAPTYFGGGGYTSKHAYNACRTLWIARSRPQWHVVTRQVPTTRTFDGPGAPLPRKVRTLQAASKYHGCWDDNEQLDHLDDDDDIYTEYDEELACNDFESRYAPSWDQYPGTQMSELELLESEMIRAACEESAREAAALEAAAQAQVPLNLPSTATPPGAAAPAPTGDPTEPCGSPISEGSVVCSQGSGFVLLQDSAAAGSAPEPPATSAPPSARAWQVTPLIGFEAPGLHEPTTSMQAPSTGAAGAGPGPGPGPAETTPPAGAAKPHVPPASPAPARMSLLTRWIQQQVAALRGCNINSPETTQDPSPSQPPPTPNLTAAAAVSDTTASTSNTHPTTCMSLPSQAAMHGACPTPAATAHPQVQAGTTEEVTGTRHLASAHVPAAWELRALPSTAMSASPRLYMFDLAALVETKLAEHIAGQKLGGNKRKLGKKVRIQQQARYLSVADRKLEEELLPGQAEPATAATTTAAAAVCASQLGAGGEADEGGSADGGVCAPAGFVAYLMSYDSENPSEDSFVMV